MMDFLHSVTQINCLTGAIISETHGLGHLLERPPPPPPSREFFFLPHSPGLLDIWAVFLMQNVPLDAALLFDLRAAILGWLLAAVQLPQHTA